MKRSYNKLLPALVLLPVILSSAPPVDSWPMHRGDQNLQGIATGKLPDKLKLLWTFQVERPKRSDGTAGLQPGIKASAVIHKGKVFVGDDNGTFHARELITGKALWTFKAEDAIEGAAMILNDQIIFGSGDGFLYCLDASGKVVWKYETADQVLAAPNWAKDPESDDLWVLAGSYDGSVHCVRARDGKPVWKYSTDNFVNGSPAIAGNKVIFGGCDTYLYVLDLATGKALNQLRQTLTSRHLLLSVARLDMSGITTTQLSPSALSPVKFFGSTKRKVFHTSLHAQLRKKKYSSVDETSPCMQSIEKLAKAFGHLRPGGRWTVPPVLCDGKVLFGSIDGNFYSINANTGEEVWSYDVGAGIIASPAVADSMVFIGDEKGNLFAFGE